MEVKTMRGAFRGAVVAALLLVAGAVQAGPVDTNGARGAEPWNQSAGDLKGLTKRETMAMELAAHVCPQFGGDASLAATNCADRAVKMTDALLERLAQPVTP